jgi:hypothetical protein
MPRRRLNRQLHVAGASNVTHQSKYRVTVSGDHGVEVTSCGHGVGNFGNIATPIDRHDVISVIDERVHGRGANTSRGTGDNGDASH